MANYENNTQKVPPIPHLRRERRKNMNHVHPGRYPMPSPPPAPEYYPMGGYYPYYQSPPPMMPPMDYVYMDLLRSLSIERELRGYLPKFDRMFDDRDPKDKYEFKDNGQKSVERIYMRKRHQSEKENNMSPSRLCFQCQQHMRCARCCQPLVHERPLSALTTMPSNCHFNASSPVKVVKIPRCSCESKTYTKHKAKKEDSRLMSNSNEYPVRDTSSFKSTRKSRRPSPNSSNNELSSNEWSDTSSVMGGEHDIKNINIKPSQRNCLSEEEGKAEYMRGDGEELTKAKSKKLKLKQRPASAYYF